MTRPTPIDRTARGSRRPLPFRPAPTTTVIVVSARPAAQAGLRAMLGAEPRLAPVILTAGEIRLPDESATIRGLSTRPAVALIDQTGFVADQFRPIVRTFHEEGIAILWLGAPVGSAGATPPGMPWGILSPDADEGTLIAAIHALAAGLTVADPELLPPPKPDLPTLPPAVTLTAREQEVLELVAAGLPNKAIARALGISDHTAKFHVSALLGKLNAGSRTEAVTIATRMGLLTV